MSIRLLDVVVVLGGASLMVTLILMFAANGPSPEVETDAAEPNRRSVARTIDAARHARQRGIHWPYLTIERGTFDDGHRGDVRVTIYGVTLAFDANDDVVFQQYPPNTSAPLKGGVDDRRAAPSYAVHFSLTRALASEALWREHARRIDPRRPIGVFLCGQRTSYVEGKVPPRDEAFGVPVKALPWGLIGPAFCVRRSITTLLIHPVKPSKYGRMASPWNRAETFLPLVEEGCYVRLPELQANFQQYISKYDIDNYREGDPSVNKIYVHPSNQQTGEALLAKCAHGYEGDFVACGFNGITDDENIEWDTTMRPSFGGGKQPHQWLSTARAVQDMVDNVLVDYGRKEMLREN